MYTAYSEKLIFKIGLYLDVVMSQQSCHYTKPGWLPRPTIFVFGFLLKFTWNLPWFCKISQKTLSQLQERRASRTCCYISLKEPPPPEGYGSVLLRCFLVLESTNTCSYTSILYIKHQLYCSAKHRTLKLRRKDLSVWPKNSMSSSDDQGKRKRERWIHIHNHAPICSHLYSCFYHLASWDFFQSLK